MKIMAFLLSVSSFFISTPASAYDVNFTGKVTFIEPTYVPDNIAFKLDVGGGNCAAGTVLTWSVRGSTEATRIANAQAILASLMTAKASGGSVSVFVNNTDCSVQFLHIL